MLTWNVALLAPAGTTTLAGTLAALLLLESATRIPPAGAGPLNVTVPVDVCTPPTTLEGFSVSEERTIAGAGTGDCSKSQIAGLGSFSGTATNLVGEIMYTAAVPPVPELIVIVPLPFVGEEVIE